jgi:predicted transcriptional regulator YheO
MKRTSRRADELRTHTAPADEVISVLRPVARGIAQMFGDLCEVVIHDFSDPEHSIVCIEGNVTRRKVGGSVTEIGLQLLRGGDDQPDLIGYTQNTKDGKALRSSSILLRDPDGHVFGCLCINLDITEIVGLRRALSHLVPEIGTPPVAVKFTDQIEEVLGRIIDEVVAGYSTPPGIMDRSEKLALVAALDRRGAFQIQRGVPTVAHLLGVSRTTVYTYLDEVRADSQTTNGGRPTFRSSRRVAAGGRRGTATVVPVNGAGRRGSG